jgi:large subunit ribosomal protein L10
VLRSEKKEFVSELEQVCKNFSGIFVTHYHGMTVPEVSKLKKSLKTKEVKFKVIKNTLAKIAAKNAGKDELISMLSGPVAIAYSQDVVSAAKLLNEFAKTNDKFKIIGGSVSGNAVNSLEVAEIAKLPSFEEIRSQLISLIQTPATKIVRLLQAPGGNVARVLNAYSEK